MTKSIRVINDTTKCPTCKNEDLEVEPINNKWKQEESIRCNYCGLTYKRPLE